jgi:hypothetical protein
MPDPSSRVQAKVDSFMRSCCSLAFIFLKCISFSVPVFTAWLCDLCYCNIAGYFVGLAVALLPVWVSFDNKLVFK